MRITRIQFIITHNGRRSRYDRFYKSENEESLSNMMARDVEELNQGFNALGVDVEIHTLFGEFEEL